MFLLQILLRQIMKQELQKTEKLLNIPLRKSKKSGFTGRVGIGADTKRMAKQIQVTASTEENVNVIEEHNLIECPDLCENHFAGDSPTDQDQNLMTNDNSINAPIFDDREKVKPAVHHQNRLSSNGVNCSAPENNLLSNNKEKLSTVKSQDKIGQTQKSLRNEEIDSAKTDEPPKKI